MKPLALKLWISLAVMACVVFTGGLASAQLGNGLAAVGGIDPTNGFPKWYLDHNGLQLGQCLDTGVLDPCGLILAGALPNPALPVSFPANFPVEFFYWRAVGRILGIGGTTGRADLVLSVQGGFGGPTLTPADGIAAAGVFARYRITITGGLVPGATYTVTGPLGSQSFVAAPTGTLKFTNDQGCVPVAGAVPPPCNFASVLPTTNAGPFLRVDPAAVLAPGFIGLPAIQQPIIGSPFNTNIVRISGPNVGGPGVNVVETNLFFITGKIYVRPATTTTLTSSANPSRVGQAVTLSATVSKVLPAPEALTGTVTFFDGATALGLPVPLSAAGTASFTTSALAAGAHSLTAVYNGNLDFAVSTSAAVAQAVKNVTATTLADVPNPSIVGQPVTLTATVTTVAPSTGVPDGTVTFFDGITALGTGTLVGGTTSVSVSTLIAGTHPITAVYNPGANFFASTSAVVSQTVNNGATISLISNLNPSTLGQAVTLTATVTSAGGVPTGTVTFKDGAATIGTATLAAGSASLTTSALAAGTHSLTAVYGGAPGFAPATSAVVTQTVRNATTTTLADIPNPSTFGQAVTLTATVAAVPVTAGVPTGTVTFMDGATPLSAPVALGVGGSASISVSTLAAGSHSLTAVYSGSATLAPSTSAVVTQVVNNTTVVTLTSGPNPSVAGQAVTLSATVISVGGVPTGTVTFKDGAVTIGAPVTLVGGSASLSTSALAVGPHSLTAVYSGAPGFLGATSVVVTQTVNAPNTTTNLVSTPNPSTVGQLVTLTATVSVVAPGTGVPGGTVTFLDGATSLGVATLGATGSASITTSTLIAGPHVLTAVYGGSATFLGSTSPAVTQTVNVPAAAATTSTSLTSTPNPSTVGQVVTLSSTVTSAAGVPAGTVTFRDGAIVLGTATLVNGSASFTTAALAAGPHSLTAAFGGNAAFAASTSPVVTQTVNAPAAAAATSTSLTSTPNPSNAGQLVTLTATVTSAAGVPAGTVTFKDGVTTLGTVTLGATGTASFTTSTLAAGAHSLTAVYNGSAAFLTSTSPVVTQTVNAVAAPVDTVAIKVAELQVAKNLLRVEGTTTALPNGTFAASVEIHNGPAVGGVCTGAILGTTADAAGTWKFQGTVTVPVTTVCVKSSAGGVTTTPVAQK